MDWRQGGYEIKISDLRPRIVIAILTLLRRRVFADQFLSGRFSEIPALFLILQGPACSIPND